MRKIAILALASILFASCELDSPQMPPRENVPDYAAYCMYYSLDCPLELFHQSMRIQEFIQADPEERKNSKYYDIAYYEASESYTVDDLGIFVPGGKALTDDGAEWIVANTYKSREYHIRKVSSDSWEITPKYPESTDFNIGYHPDFFLTVKCESQELSEDAAFSVFLNGHCYEDSEYYVIFGDAKGLTAKWVAVSDKGTVSRVLSLIGSIELTFRKGQDVLDTVIATYSGRGNASFVTKAKN